MRSFLRTACLLGAVSSCNRAKSADLDTTAVTPSGREAIIAYSDTVSIAARVDSIEKYAAQGRLKLYASVSDRRGLVPVKDTASWPESVESSFNIVHDSAGHILVHREMPTSESGDWYISVSHYFDQSGRTIFYEWYASSFSSECTRILRETIRVFRNPASGSLIAQTSNFRNIDDQPVDTAGCYLRSEQWKSDMKSTAAELPLPIP